MILCDTGYERVEPFPSNCARDRYAAVRRSTTFSCSSNRLRRRSSRNSASRSEVGPGLTPSSTSAARSDFDNVLGWTQKRSVSAQRDAPTAATSDPDHVLAELPRERLRHSDILPARRTAKRSQTSQISAADPPDRSMLNSPRAIRMVPQVSLLLAQRAGQLASSVSSGARAVEASPYTTCNVTSVKTCDPRAKLTAY